MKRHLLLFLALAVSTEVSVSALPLLKKRPTCEEVQQKITKTHDELSKLNMKMPKTKADTAQIKKLEDRIQRLEHFCKKIEAQPNGGLQQLHS